MQPPPLLGDFGLFAKARLGLGPTAHRTLAVGCEDVGAAGNARLSLNDRPRLRAQWHRMFDAVFSALTLQDKQTTLQVQLGPAHPRNFIAPAPAEQQHTECRSERTTVILAGEPEPTQLVIGKGARSWLLLERPHHSRGRSRLDHVPRLEPAEKLTQDAEGPIGEIGPIRRNVLDQLDHVTTPGGG